MSERSGVAKRVTVRPREERAVPMEEEGTGKSEVGVGVGGTLRSS